MEEKVVDERPVTDREAIRDRRSLGEKRGDEKTFDIINEQVRSNRGGQVRGRFHSVSIRESDFYRLVTREWEREETRYGAGIGG